MKKTKTLFDCSKKPKIPYDDWTVESHNTSLGKIDLSKLELYLDEEQKNGKYIEGNKLREKLKDKPVLNANVLDYLYEHQSLIPESWKGKCVYFWGTIFRLANGDLGVRSLYFNGGAWRRYYHWLDDDWYSDDPAAIMTPELNKAIENRILSNVVKTKDCWIWHCWIWQGYKRDGYGQIVVNNKQEQAHRIVYQLLCGKIPKGLVLDHLCRDRLCVNPDHLEPVTNKENIMRGIGLTAKNAKKTNCPKGHAYTKENTRISKGKRYCNDCGKLRKK